MAASPGVDEQGNTIEISDPLLPLIQLAVQNSTEDESRVDALLALDAIFGNELPQVLLFTQAVKDAYLTLLTEGARATVAQYVEKLSKQSWTSG